MYISSLSKIFTGFPFAYSYFPCSEADPQITSLTADSRQVQPGGLFIAMSGDSADGHQFIPAAISKGAVAVIGELPITGLTVPYIRVENTRQSLASLAAAFYGHPARRLTMIGVTGTDGKTTTSNILYEILLAAGYKTGLISTVNAVIGTEVLDTGFHVTTPDAPDVQRYLAKMVDAGLSHVILETTSHGLAQYRVDACEFDIGILTNITHEHLDYHGSFEKYRAAKARLFTSLAETLSKAQGNIRLGVLNRDDLSFDYLSEAARSQIVSYGLSPLSDFRAEKISHTLDGIRFTVCGKGINFEVASCLHGLYNVSNCLAALAAAIGGMGVEPLSAIKGIANLMGVPGRMERIDMGQEFSTFVDFAHTPNALKVSLETSRQIISGDSSQDRAKTGHVIVICGSAGLRDKEKRRLMAEVSTQLADFSIFTAEDPRSESLDGILDEMASGACSKGGFEGQSFWRVRDRGEAIRLAVKMAHPGDIVLACGKGHEQSMCFGETEYAWDDRIAVRAALSEFLGLAGPQMPYLPTQEKP